MNDLLRNTYMNLLQDYKNVTIDESLVANADKIIQDILSVYTKAVPYTSEENDIVKTSTIEYDYELKDESEFNKIINNPIIAKYQLQSTILIVLMGLFANKHMDPMIFNGILLENRRMPLIYLKNTSSLKQALPRGKQALPRGLI